MMSKSQRDHAFAAHNGALAETCGREKREVTVAVKVQHKGYGADVTVPYSMALSRRIARISGLRMGMVSHTGRTVEPTTAMSSRHFARCMPVQ